MSFAVNLDVINIIIDRTETLIDIQKGIVPHRLMFDCIKFVAESDELIQLAFDRNEFKN